MTDERLGRAAAQRLREKATPHPDPHAGVQKAMTQVRQTDQVRRRLWSPSWRRKSASLSDIDRTSDDQPTAGPASIGHNPIAIGRTQFMISPAKAITAGAFVFALGGAFLIAQPFDQHEGGVPGAESGDALAATSVTGTIAWASSCASPTVTSVEGKMQERGAGCIDRMVTSDDTRLAGTSEISWNKDIHVTDDGRRRAIRSMSENIRASGGGWVCRTPAVLDEGTGHFHTPAQGTDLYTCIGDGANAGLMSILIVDTRADGSRSDPFEGLIFPGELPPAPEIAAAD